MLPSCRIFFSLFFLLFIFGKVVCQDFSFILLSDLHFKGDSLHYNRCKDLIYSINSNKEDFVTNTPAFVWVLGDITDTGKEEQWNEYVSLFGLNGDSLLKYNVFESFGNHDGNVDGYVRAQIKKRNKIRGYNIFTDSLGLHYSWNMNGIHFVNLNLYPGNEWEDSCEWCKYFKESFREPQYSLSFLEQDLKKNVGNSETPIIIGFHIGFDEFGLKWWTENQREQFYNVIKNYNILAVFSGHNHQFRSAIWKDIRVINVESPFNSIIKGEYMKIIIDRRKEISIQHISY